MNIEFKNAMSQSSQDGETDIFYAGLYLDGYPAGLICKQDDFKISRYIPFDERGAVLIHEAEIYCRRLPPATIDLQNTKLSIDMSLTTKIELFIAEFRNGKEEKYRNDHFHDAMNQNLVIGIPGESFETIQLIEPIAEHQYQEDQYDWLLDFINGAEQYLINGKMILNTNLNIDLLERSNLTPDQYVQPNNVRTEEINTSRSKGR